MYSKVQQLKTAGFSQRAVANQLNLHRKTVRRYWTMSVEEYKQYAEINRREECLNVYRERIVGWLRDYPTLSAAQVCDWLKEHYDASFSERTVSRFVKKLREEYHLYKRPNPRSYEAVPELPMGQQIQVDFGQTTLKRVNGGWQKVFVAAFLLSASRYKYAETQSRPFTSADLVKICHRCFHYFGGIPQEMVFDQDSIVCSSENTGDIIYTYEFEKFRQDCKMQIYLCRGADPESKGKIENTVKYIKGNFLNNRLYADDDILNHSCLEWLNRTGNAKVHGTTKCIPAEVFLEEREFLKPLIATKDAPEPSVCRMVRKDNTILYGSNRYSVPLGTYNNQREVKLEITENTLSILTTFGDFICEHSLETGRGLLIQSKNHRRDRTSSLDKIQAELSEQLNKKADVFLNGIRTEKSRYARDQFQLVSSLICQYDLESVLQAVAFCTDNRIYSANTLRDFLAHIAQQTPKTVEIPNIVIPVDDVKYHVTTQKRDVSIYAKVGAAK
ncbi:MAG: IS21 family transposase [Faecalibacterium sp.]